MCCVIAALLLALFPAWTGGREALLRGITNMRRAAIVGGAAFTVIAGSALAAGAHSGDAPWTQKICSFMDGS
jgi:hypothetical protein